MLNYICHVDTDTHVAVQPSQAPPPQLSCWTGLDWGYWVRAWQLPHYPHNSSGKFWGVNAFLLANRKAASPLQITFQGSQMKSRAKGYRHTPKPAEGTPTAPQGSRRGWETFVGQQ